MTRSADNSTSARPRKGLRVLIVCLAVLCVLAAACLALIFTHKVVLFRHGIYLWNAERVELDILEEEIPNLDYLTNLKEADLRESACFREIAAWADEHPHVNVLYTVTLPDGLTFDETTRTIDFTRVSEDDLLLLAEDYMEYYRDVRTAKIDAAGWSFETLRAFQNKYPNVKMTGTIPVSQWPVAERLAASRTFPNMTVVGPLRIGPVEIPFDAAEVDLSALTVDEIGEFEQQLVFFPNLARVDFGTEAAHEKLRAVSAFAKAHPELGVAYTMTAFGEEVGFHTPILDFNHITMTDDGAEVRELLDLLPNVKKLDMDFCGVDDEHMAAIRDDYPDVDVVWRVWFSDVYSVRTDVTKILASAFGRVTLTPETAYPLRYCTKVKYLDVGHNETIGDISFISYMPDLEVLIVALCDVIDFEPLADCPHLEFLEIFTNRVRTLEPLRNLKELKHLNICWNTKLADLSPIYGLTQLERLWIGCKTKIPQEQIDHFRELAPDCVVNDTCTDPHTDWREGTERYELLKKQLGYPYGYQFWERDPLYKPHGHEDMHGERYGDAQTGK